MTTPLRVDLVDISHWQSGRLDMAAGKRAGVKGVYHKATEGTTWTDNFYERRRGEARAAGLPFGAYHFARPSKTDAVAEARHFLRFSAPQPGDLIPMLDLEANDDKLSKAELTQWVGQFVTEVKGAVGVIPIIYTPFDLGADYGALLWVARYSNANAAPRVPSPWSKWAVRQFSDGTYGVPKSVDGFGNVDLNQLEVPLKALLIPEVKKKPEEKPPNRVETARLGLSAEIKRLLELAGILDEIQDNLGREADRLRETPPARKRVHDAGDRLADLVDDLAFLEGEVRRLRRKAKRIYGDLPES